MDDTERKRERERERVILHVHIVVKLTIINNFNKHHQNYSRLARFEIYFAAICDKIAVSND